MTDRPTPRDAACELAEFYAEPFGGKPNGSFRISPKNLRRLLRRRRITEEFVRLLSEELFELGYIFTDMETFYTVTSARKYTNYRRLSDTLIV